MSTTNRNTFVQMFADLLQCTFLALEWSLSFGEVCEMSEALQPTHGSQVGWSLVNLVAVGSVLSSPYSLPSTSER